MAEKITNQSKPRVLVADDEQVIANTLAIILNQAGFEARAVYSGEKAIDALDTFHPDMLISDVIMTGMTGIEAAIQTRARLPHARSCCSPVRPRRQICWNGHARKGMSSRSWPSPCIRPTCWRSSAANLHGRRSSSVLERLAFAPADAVPCA